MGNSVPLSGILPAANSNCQARCSNADRRLCIMSPIMTDHANGGGEGTSTCATCFPISGSYLNATRLELSRLNSSTSSSSSSTCFLARLIFSRTPSREGFMADTMGILWAENESLSSVRVNPNRKRERDWRSQSLRVASSSRCWIRLLRRSLGNGAGKNRVEHSSRVVPVVVAEHVLVQVGLKPLGGYAVIHAPKTVLQVCPETVNSAGVYIPLDIHLRRVIDAPMFVSRLLQVRVSGQFVRVDQRSGQDVLAYQRHQRIRRPFGKMYGPEFPATLDVTSDHLLVLTPCTRRLLAGTVSPLPSDVGFIDFDSPAKWGDILGEQGANTIEHTPCRLIGNAQFPLHLLGRDSATSARHKVDRVEPQAKRCGRILKNQIG